MNDRPPTALKPTLHALRASLRGAKEEGLRERLTRVIASLERSYGASRPPTPQDEGDLRRRTFVADRHPAPSRKRSSDFARTDELL